MKIMFLGTGGGRFVTASQLRSTGGWILEMDNEKISIDPGPGALLRAKETKTSLANLSGVVISHCHPDHYTDGEVMIEAMTRGTKTKRGFLISNEYVIKGGGGFVQKISPYHLNLVERVFLMEAGKKAKTGNIEITATRAVHTEPKTIGFVFRGTKTIGYISDSEYYKGMEKNFKGCDYLVLNTLRPKAVRWPKHLNTEGASKIIAEVNPEAAIITHFGILMLKASPKKEAAWIEEKTGVKTTAAADGMEIDFRKPSGIVKSYRNTSAKKFRRRNNRQSAI